MGSIRHLPVASKAPDFPFQGGDDGEHLLQVGDVAKASGKTVRAIHHYEEVGLLRPHARSKGRYRLYDQAALRAIVDASPFPPLPDDWSRPSLRVMFRFDLMRDRG